MKNIFLLVFILWEYFLQYRLLYLGLCTAANTLCKAFSNEVKFLSIGILYLGIIYFSILHRYFSSYLHDSGHSCIHLHFSLHNFMMTAIFCGWMNCDNIVLKKVRKRIEIERIKKIVYGVFQIVWRLNKFHVTFDISLPKLLVLICIQFIMQLPQLTLF